MKTHAGEKSTKCYQCDYVFLPGYLQNPLAKSGPKGAWACKTASLRDFTQMSGKWENLLHCNEVKFVKIDSNKKSTYRKKCIVFGWSFQK